MIEENPTILKIDFILKSGYDLSTYSYARGFDVTFFGGQCSDYSLEIPEGFPRCVHRVRGNRRRDRQRHIRR